MHPLNPDVQRQLYIDQTRISHLINKVWFEGNVLKGVVECAPTCVGRDMQGLVRRGSKVAFSMRGFGPVSEKKGDIVHVKDPLQILTYDWVIHPSHPSAYMGNIIQESTMSLLTSENDEPIKDVYKPITESMIINYINNQSKNVQSMSEQLEFSRTPSRMSYNPKTNMVLIKEGADMLAVYLEHNIKKDIDNYLSNLSETNNFYNFYDVDLNREKKRGAIISTDGQVIGGGNQVNGQPVEDDLVDADPSTANTTELDKYNYTSSKSYEDIYDEYNDTNY